MLTEAERLRRKETRQRNEAAKKERRERETAERDEAAEAMRGTL